MPDRDSVINDLNVAKLMLCNPKVLTPEMCVKIGQAITSTIVLLKEQEPKNVIADRHEVLRDDSYDEAQYFEDVFYRCPSCDRVLSRTHMKRDICFCEKCGQELKWE